MTLNLFAIMFLKNRLVKYKISSAAIIGKNQKLAVRDYGCFFPGQGGGDDILVEEWKEAMFAHVTQVTCHMSHRSPTF